MLHTITCNGSTLCYENTPGIYTGEYYLYCCRLLVEAMKECSNKINIIIGPYHYTFDNNNSVVRLDIQPEHTLVKSGGRSVSEPIMGNTLTKDDKETYLVRIDKFDYYKSLDGVIEYSIPNIINMHTCSNEEIAQFAKKCRYIAPLIYETDRLENNERSGVFTLFSLGSSSRREVFHKSTGIENISEVFCPAKLAELYYNKAIMVNIHQTDHHHTFEELRVLPALSQGIVVVAEDSPLKEHIPYSDSIVWSSLEDMNDVVLDVERNYQSYRDKLFTEKLSETLDRLRQKNTINISELIWQNKTSN
jgi:hypothetical protein